MSCLVSRPNCSVICVWLRKMAAQYNVSEQGQKILLQKAQRKMALREQFLKLKTDPFQHASGGTGISSGTVVSWVIVLCHH